MSTTSHSSPPARPVTVPPEAAADPDRALGVAGFTFADLFVPQRLAALHAEFDGWFKARAPEDYARFDAYRACKGEGMEPQAVSEALLAATPHVSAFVGKLFGVEKELDALRIEVHDREPLWRFKRDFAKKRVLRADAGKAWHAGPGAEAVARRVEPEGDDSGASVSSDAAHVATTAMRAVIDDGARFRHDEELEVARATLALFEVDDVARKAAKAGGAQWTDALRSRADAVRAALDANEKTRDLAAKFAGAQGAAATDADRAKTIAFALDAIEAWLAVRHGDPSDPAARWPSLEQPKTLDYNHLVHLRRPEPEKLPELFVGHDEERRERHSFALTDRRMNARQVEQEIDYCLYCHDRDKDSCSKGLREKPTAQSPGVTFKKNPLGVPLQGCPLEEKISEMHTMRRDGDVLGALALVLTDNPMCPGTGHRICNDCMKACVFQKQQPVNIPQIETRVLTESLSLPWGIEIYGLLTRWNPLNVHRPYAKPYNGKNVLVVGLGPAGYTLTHHLLCEGFGVVAVDGLKIEPLDPRLTGKDGKPPIAIRDFGALYGELDERILMGFGGVSEYGITARWDKNFLTVMYLTLSRNPNLRIYGGVRFGGTLTLDDAWRLGIDHVAIAAGAGRPTLIDIKNNLSRGMRKASDFLMALQLTGAYKKSSIANLQVMLPAVVVGGGLTAIDTATELLAYYVVQIEKTADRFAVFEREKSPEELRAMFDDEEWEFIQIQLGHAKELAAERALAEREGREPRVQELVDKWGGVTLVYRKSLADSPAYRLNHEEVEKSLEEGVRYVEGLSPTEAVLDERGHVKGMKFARKDGVEVELPARTVCVAAGTSPNVTYEREYAGTFKLDAKGQYFLAHKARVEGDKAVLEPVTDKSEGFFTSYAEGRRVVSFYGDNHPYYAGSVVRAMASAKDGYKHVVALFPEIAAQRAADQAQRDGALKDLFARLDDELVARVVEVNRLTQTIVEVVVHAPMAARKFQPGQFYRLQNFESLAPIVDGTRLAMEGLALTGAWTDPEKGLLGTIVLEMGGSSRLCAALKPGEPIILMGPTGTPTEISGKETVLLCGGGLGNAVLFSIARAFKALGARVLYFAGYKRGEDLFKQDDIERFTDQVIWCTDQGASIAPRRPQDHHYRGNIVQAMIAYAKGELGGPPQLPFSEVNRILAIGSDRMMAAVQEARRSVLRPLLNPRHLAIGSINSPMQCMMKEVCAQCLQKQRDPQTGKEYVVFSCFNQDQELDRVDFQHLRARLRANSMQEKLSNAWLDRILAKKPELLRV
jgi:NADPH-dependent glutamate synthase beta subunit-like oxidoreductase/NAD(P)H-flavin reductase